MINSTVIYIQWCPDECFACPEGTECLQGKRKICKEGTFSDGKGAVLKFSRVLEA